METTELVINSITSCSIETCPMVESCPIGAMPGGQCKLKSQYVKDVDTAIHKMYPEKGMKPEVAIKVNYLLVPLFEQMLLLRMAGHGKALVKKGTTSALLREMRDCIKLIDSIINSTSKAYNNVIKQNNPLTRNGGSDYYDMLFDEGVTGPDANVGFPAPN